ncbi:hypothetical protein GOBAR_AA27447 [Gossypium barbadense]|uniref:Uncharacterized protein n=1 Tax=Gossypium barbadense TaxID=3634 RepID=A0A2P5WQ52_GOSBA|nr:hypothetical protein GOBAR_AA27447 [Gossypium barbadense]
MRFTHSFGQNQVGFGQNQHVFHPNYAFGQNWTPARYYGGPMHKNNAGQHNVLEGHLPRLGPSRLNLVDAPHGPSRPFAPYNGVGAGNFDGHLNDCGPVSNCVQVSSSVSTFVPLVQPHLSQSVSISGPVVPLLAQSSPHAGCSFVPVTALSGVGSDREPNGCSSGNNISSRPTDIVEEVSVGPLVVDVPISNMHPMVTRAKASVFKPKSSLGVAP